MDRCPRCLKAHPPLCDLGGIAERDAVIADLRLELETVKADRDRFMKMAERAEEWALANPIRTDVCQACKGKRVVIGPGGFAPCEACKGFGVVA